MTISRSTRAVLGVVPLAVALTIPAAGPALAGPPAAGNAALQALAALPLAAGDFTSGARADYGSDFFLAGSIPCTIGPNGGTTACRWVTPSAPSGDVLTVTASWAPARFAPASAASVARAFARELPVRTRVANQGTDCGRVTAAEVVCSSPDDHGFVLHTAAPGSVILW